MAIAEGIAAAKGAFEVSKLALDLLRHPDVDSQAVHAKLLELQGLILSAQAALNEAAEENRGLSERIRQLEDDSGFESETEYDGVLWHVKDGKRDEFPYCQRCWAVNRKKVRLLNLGVTYQCPEDDKNYQTEMQRLQNEY